LKRERAETLAKSLVDDLSTRMRAMISKLSIYPLDALDTNKGSNREAGSIKARTDAEIESEIDSLQRDKKILVLERMVELLEQKVEITKGNAECWNEKALKEAEKAHRTHTERNPTTSRDQVVSTASLPIQSKDRNNSKPQHEKPKNPTYIDDETVHLSPKREHHVKHAEYPQRRVY